jgi:integrase
MALTDTKLQRLPARERPYQCADGGGLYVEAQPTGKKVWRMQYRLGGRDARKERVTLGEYPAHTIAQARLGREHCRALVAHGRSPAASIEARFIATARSWDVALTQPEIGQLLRAIYQSSIRRQYKLAPHLLILCMVRKGELIGARWDEIDFDKAQWLIPAERMKKDKPHLVPLSRQAVAVYEELKGLASKSPWVLPSRNTLKEPIAHSTLNQAIRSLDLGVRDFVIHDFRRTVSTQLHEAGFNSDWIEEALAHEQKGVRGVYNKAEYLAKHREMLQ